MKIIDVPQTGKLGLTVTYPSRNGLIRRSWVVPANPQTADQLVVRSRLANRAAAYDALTEAQQDAWIAAAAQEQSRPTLGQSGPLTGLQLYLKINANLEMVGEPTVTTPPAKPTFTGVVTTGLVITNTGGNIVLKLSASGSSSAFQLVRGASPQNSGTRRIISKRYLGQLPEVTGGFATITTIYSAKFGVPAAGQRIFITVNEMADGWQGIESVYTALVPASS